MNGAVVEVQVSDPKVERTTTVGALVRRPAAGDSGDATLAAGALGLGDASFDEDGDASFDCIACQNSGTLPVPVLGAGLLEGYSNEVRLVTSAAGVVGSEIGTSLMSSYSASSSDSASCLTPNNPLERTGPGRYWGRGLRYEEGVASLDEREDTEENWLVWRLCEGAAAEVG